VVDLQVFLNNALRDTRLKGQHGSVRDLVEGAPGDFGFAVIEPPIPGPPAPSGSAKGRVTGALAMTTAKDQWAGGKLYVGCASWAGACALMQTFHRQPSETRVTCSVGWKSSIVPKASVGFLITKVGERKVTSFQCVESGAAWNRQIAVAMRIVDPEVLAELQGDERRAIVAAGLADALQVVGGTCALCSEPSDNLFTVDDGVVCEPCAVRTALLASCAPGFEEETFEGGFPPEWAGRGQCAVETCEGHNAETPQWVYYTEKGDMVAKCHACWRKAMVSAKYAYSPQLNEEMDRPMLDSLMGQAYAVMQHISSKSPAFLNAQ
jgi:hypothetical protein